MSEIPDSMRGLLDAGFTADELEAIATDIRFGVIVAEETGTASLSLRDGIEWTPEKRAAWNAAVGDILGRVSHPTDGSEDSDED